MQKFNAVLVVAWPWFCAAALATDAVPVTSEPVIGEDTVQTVVDATVRTAPDAAAAVAFAVAAGTELTWVVDAKRDGFYRVIRQDKGPQGWIAAGDIKVVHEHPHGKTQDAKVCSASLSECPARGCAHDGTTEAKANGLKRTKPAGEVQATLSFEDFAQLQHEADEMVGQGPRDLSLEQRFALTELKVSSGMVSEGDLVRVIAYLAKGATGLHANMTGESVNCMLKGKSDNDFHIPAVKSADAKEIDGIVVEMIPQDRPTEWTIDALKEVQAKGAQVWIEGGLSYDKVHYVNADSNNPLKDEPNRMSLWEVHPITKFLVCRKDRCDPENEKDWSALSPK